MAVNDSNAIGELYVCAGLLKEPERHELQRLLRSYVEERLALTVSRADEEDLQRKLRKFAAMYDDMQVLVRRAVDEGTPIVEPLVEKLGNLGSTQAARLAALRDRLTPSVLLLLCLSAVLSMLLLGRQEGAARKFRPGSAVGFAVLVTLSCGPRCTR